ncbi:ribonuclease E/G [Maritimibacter sp. UBA3975]|uniref:Rne/Rng family ribonuclease n=1 Tax=Maritimibacter sp. UBA3975 TaxID=1946833 RepID=UPI000C0A16D9|nr:ribonuclease E/G [Maritimibacter sp. UBA3975]MAM60126.1 ribonuclease [Maritimibacter sp.]|tara:strand:+ start:8621 stop:11485 length:2865 start_codon:yes stop_codon:yes gene_type:complete
MPKKMLIDATHAEETRVVVVDGNKVEEFDFESENKRQLAGNIYLAKVTRVEPSLQAAFVDYGGNRHGFLAFSEIHPDYYQIPVADREALLEEERAYAEAMAAKDEEGGSSRSRSRRRSTKAEDTASEDEVATRDVDPAGMDVIDLDAPQDDEASSPMERVGDTPVEEPDEMASDTGESEVDSDDDGDTDAKPSRSRRSRSRSSRSRGRSKSNSDEDDDDNARVDASERDDTIESVADDDDHEDIRPPRKPRPRKYKIQEVVKVRQILLVQVVKEERGNKGAALTTYLSLAGRYCVLMPNTARGGGISRKITNAVDRKKLKEIAGELEVPKGAGLIVRTAGAKRTKSEIKRDYEYLQRMWEQIRELTLQSTAPAKIYEEGDLIKRSIRDLYNKDIDEVLVEGEGGYRIAKDFMKMIMPSHAKNVKNYHDSLPLLARYQVESYLSSMFNPTVQLRSGGYIVIGVTEALVAIDVNSGRATKEGSIEETALKTNLEAAEEVARQLRLRDLAGLIVIDFIDMEERKNNNAVEKKLKDKLKTDRARIQVGRISGFGLLEMSRQRLRPGMIEATTQPCPHCHGTGLIRSDDNLALTILRQLEEEGTRGRSKEVCLKAPVGIINFLMNTKREHIAQIEARYGMAIRLEADPFLISPDYEIEKFKTATRVVAEVTTPVVSVNASLMEDLEEDEVDVEDETDEAEAEAEESQEQRTETSEDDDQPKKKRRRRRRRGGRGRNKSRSGEDGQDDNGSDDDQSGDTQSDAPAEADAVTAAPAEAEGEQPAEAEEKPKRKRAPRKTAAQKAAEAEAAAAEGEAAADAPSEAEEKPKRKRAPRKTAAQKAAEAEAAAAEAEAGSDEVASEPVAEEKPKRKRAPRKTAAQKAAEAEAEAAKADAESADPAPEPTPEPEVTQAPADPEPEVQPEPAQEAEKEMASVGASEAEAPKPEKKPASKRRGWWNRG